MDQELSPEAVESIKKAKAAQSALHAAGAMPPTEGANPVINNEPEIAPQQPQPEEEKIYETFVELKNLPSKGMFYKELLKAQPMKTPDLLLIQGITDDNMTSRFTEIFGRRVRGVNAHSILMIDEYYISLWLRDQTFPDYLFPHVGYECNKCGLKVPTDMAEFTFKQIEVKTNLEELKDEFGEKGYVEKELPMSKQIVKIHPKRRIHLARTEKIMEDEYYSKKIDAPEGIEVLLSFISPVEIGDMTDLREIFQYVQSDDFPPADLIELIKMCTEYTITEELVVNLTCPDPNCKEVTSESGYPFRHETYFPIYSNRKSETGKD